MTETIQPLTKDEREKVVGLATIILTSRFINNVERDVSLGVLRYEATIAALESSTIPQDWIPVFHNGVVSDRERGNAFAEILHEIVRPDNGYCPLCHAYWYFRADGSWSYLDGDHHPHCVIRRVIEQRLARRGR